MQHMILDWVLETHTQVYTDANLLGQLTTFEWEARREVLSSYQFPDLDGFTVGMWKDSAS